MSIVIQLRGDTAANWTSVNPILAQRELAIETDTMKYKIGDGVTYWTGLTYASFSGVSQVMPGTNVYIGGTNAFPTINVSAATLATITVSGASSFQTVSATTYISGSTDLNTYFGIIGNQLSTKANLSGATFTGNVIVPTLSASTFSGGTYLSGGTNLYNIFATRVQPWEFAVALSDETTQITTGTSKLTMTVPFSGTITGVTVSLSQSGSSVTTVNIKNSGTTIFSTKATVDANEFDSSSAATPPVITGSTMPQNARISFDIDTAGTGAAGIKVWVYGYRSI